MIHNTEEIDERIDIERSLCVLTSRQMEVIRLRINGYTLEEIGVELGISKQVVCEHIGAIKKKFRKYPDKTTLS